MDQFWASRPGPADLSYNRTSPFTIISIDHYYHHHRTLAHQPSPHRNLLYLHLYTQPSSQSRIKKPFRIGLFELLQSDVHCATASSIASSPSSWFIGILRGSCSELVALDQVEHQLGFLLGVLFSMVVLNQPIEEDPVIDPELEKTKACHPKKLREYEKDDTKKARKKQKGAIVAYNKPSYCLKQGIGSCLQYQGESVRSQHRKRLWTLLNKLLQCHNWVEASGVMNVLLQGALKDRSISRNRAKYWAALEILNHIKGEKINPRRIQGVYELWMKKNGSLRNWSPKSRFGVHMEFIIICLQRGNTKDAYQAAHLLMQGKGFDSDPVSNLVVGLAFYQHWYSGIPKELQLEMMDSCEPSTIKVEFPMNRFDTPLDNSKESDALEGHTDSNSSIANDKEVLDGDEDEKKEFMQNNDESSNHPSLHDEDCVEEEENSEQSNYSGGDLPRASIFHTQGLPRWLLPLNLPNSHENLGDVVIKHRKLQDDDYKTALKHLRVALHSVPPVIEAIHPLIQLLVLGDRVNEALDELENLSQSSTTVLQLRLKAKLLEHFDVDNYVKLSAHFEGILEKDPTCSDSLARLLVMHQQGQYETQNLTEMIALHLDATKGSSETWKELASCLFKLSQCEDDIFSTCGDQYSSEILGNSNKIPEIFTNNETGNGWNLRCRWWLNRHFHNKIIHSDIASGDLELLTYKAATASHLYGRHFEYVMKTIECLEKEDNMELYSFLQMHILNSIGFYSV